MSDAIQTVHNFVTPEPWRQHAITGPQAQRQSTNRAGQGPSASQELSTYRGKGGGLNKGITPKGVPGCVIHSSPLTIC